ncbi:hypothetical protein [Psychrobacter glaciei]|uniref:hypothetical protein n=1 Tax=Psychrobacter glaciei TaxID=619771 RepID=UPI001F05F1FA|nr:hypothetical protein [Psychrobacter glaciei]MCH1781849.1 hypothetical protein [Psychrobacter glaciei]
MKSLYLVIMSFSLFIVGCNFDISQPQAISGKTIVNNEDKKKYSKLIEEVDKEVSYIKMEASNSDESKVIKETKLPLTLNSYTNCNMENNNDFCKNRFSTYDIKVLPTNLKEGYTDIKYIDTILKLPNINDIEVYILARNMTDVEEYTIVTYNKKIIDKLLIGKIGSADNSDRIFSISENYKNIEINFNDKSKNYKVNNSGNIL